MKNRHTYQYKELKTIKNQLYKSHDCIYQSILIQDMYLLKSKYTLSKLEIKKLAKIEKDIKSLYKLIDNKIEKLK